MLALQGEDTALALELQCRGRTGVYLREQLAVGEAPDEVRAICQQKSRWCKGGMQM
jgi:cellulose synthase/poly-beta-1,6-N-acetylglucosamine synthase-like glycosyltransferase